MHGQIVEHAIFIFQVGVYNFSNCENNLLAQTHSTMASLPWQERCTRDQKIIAGDY